MKLELSDLDRAELRGWAASCGPGERYHFAVDHHGIFSTIPDPMNIPGNVIHVATLRYWNGEAKVSPATPFRPDLRRRTRRRRPREKENRRHRRVRNFLPIIPQP